MNDGPLFVTHWWGSKYEHYAKRWETNCKRFNLDYIIVEKSSTLKTNNQERINSKANFVLQCLRKYQRPIVFTDVDMVIQHMPTELLNCKNIDFCAPNWNGDIRVSDGPVRPDVFETVSQVIYFNNTTTAKRLLRLWISTMRKEDNRKKADDRVLALVFHDNKAHDWCRWKWLPVEYFYIPQYYSHLRLGKKAVIVHPHDLTSEEEANRNGSDVSRIPKGYHRITNKLKRKSIQTKQ